MAITFRAADTQQGSASSLTINKPTGTADGDVMVAVISAYSSGGAITITPPAGWTQRTTVTWNIGVPVRTSSFTKLAASEGSSYVFTISAAGGASGGSILSYQGGAAALPDVSATSSDDSADGSYVCPSLTTTVAGTIAIFASCLTGTGAFSVDAATTQRVNVSNGNFSFIIGDETRASAGATGTRTHTGPSKGDASVSIALSIPVVAGFTGWGSVPI